MESQFFYEYHAINTKRSNTVYFKSVLGIRDILVRIRIRGPVTLANGSDSFLQWQDAKKKIHIFFFQLTRRHIIFSIKNLMLLKDFIFKSFTYFSPLNTFMRRGKDPDPDPYPYLWIMDPDPGGLKICGSCLSVSGSWSPTLFQIQQKSSESATLFRQIFTNRYWFHD